jgi:hypothetical protein
MAGHFVEKSSDRIFVLAPIAGGARGSTGIVDKQLFTGGNRLHAILDNETCLWKLKYDNGGLPPALKQKWTNFSKLYTYVEDYMKKRNIEIKEVID